VAEAKIVGPGGRRKGSVFHTQVTPDDAVACMALLREKGAGIQGAELRIKDKRGNWVTYK
jgi:hypothetical protein